MIGHRADDVSVGARTNQLTRELPDANFRFSQKIVELGDRQQRLLKDQSLRRAWCDTEQIAKAVDELLDEGANRFVFDLEQCHIVNSMTTPS